jgi:hypothetical protein
MKWKILKEAAVAYFETLSSRSLDEIEENHEYDPGCDNRDSNRLTVEHKPHALPFEVTCYLFMRRSV